MNLEAARDFYYLAKVDARLRGDVESAKADWFELLAEFESLSRRLADCGGRRADLLYELDIVDSGRMWAHERWRNARDRLYEFLNVNGLTVDWCEAA